MSPCILSICLIVMPRPAITSDSTVIACTAWQLISAWRQPAWVAYVLVATFVGIASQFTWCIYRRSEQAGRPLPRSHVVLPAMFALSSAIVGTQCVVQAKVCA